MLYYSGLIINDDLNRRCISDLSFLDSEECLELSRRSYRRHLNTTQFLYSRLLLKILLSHVLNVTVFDLSIRSAPSGRPILFYLNQYYSRIDLSISHDRDKIFVAVGFDCRCGVDVQAVSGVDWFLVMRSMGWGSFLQYSSCCDYFEALSFEHKSALLWSAYEAWIKLIGDRSFFRDFLWREIILIEYDAVTESSIYQMTLAESCSHSHAIIFLSLRPNEVLAVATF